MKLVGLRSPSSARIFPVPGDASPAPLSAPQPNLAMDARAAPDQPVRVVNVVHRRQSPQRVV
jgi:hypothetical protein